MRIIIGGALGRMGRELGRAATEAGDTVACGVDVAYLEQASDFPMVTDYRKIQAQADVLIDFSNPNGLPGLLGYAIGASMPLVLCTTGYTEEELTSITEAARMIPILRSANMSLGINVMQQLVSMAARALGEGYDVEIIEKHHRQKLDSPSGTAMMLFDSVRQARGEQMLAIHGRCGRTAKRGENEIGIHAVRGGTVTGEHEVGFYGKAEQIILTHRAESRALLAEGALRAARFLADQTAGLYGMQDVVRALLS